MKKNNTFKLGRSVTKIVPFYRRRKGKKPRSKRLKTEEHEDLEIDMEIQQHGEENVRIISDSDPR